MPPSATATLLIRTAAAPIWQAWLDLPGWPRWQPETAEGRWLQGDSWAEGSTFGLLRRTPWPLLGRLPGANARRFTGHVQAVSNESLLVWELRPTALGWLGPVVVESVRLDAAPGGTTVTLTLTAHGLLPTLLSPLLPGRLWSQANATLDGLHRHLAPIERRQ
jgi:hypothetical protein